MIQILNLVVGFILNKVNLNQVDKKVFNCHHEYNEIDYKDIQILNKDDVSNFRICSFDIECDSSHGDFPNPRKILRN